MSDDSGEMVAASFCLGIAHPPGYPLFCLLGRLFSFLPLGQPAFRFNLLAAVFGLFSLMFLFDLSYLSLRKRMFFEGGFTPKIGLWLSIGTPLFLFVNNDFFSQCMTAKGAVYTLTLLFLSGTLDLYVRDRLGLAPKALAPFLFFITGLGLAHHWQTQILWVPFVVFWIYRRKEPWNAKTFFRAFTLTLVGLSLYLYLPLRGALGIQPSWGAPQVWAGFRWIISRAPFAGLEPVFRSPGVYAEFVGGYFKILLNHWIPGFTLAALLGFWALWKKSREDFYALLLFYLPMILGILTVPRPETLFLIPVYLVPANALWAFLGFVGLSWAAIRFKRFRFAGWTLLFVLGVEVCFTGFVVFKTEDKSLYFASSDFGLNALKNLPKQSLFLAEGDHYVMPIFYQRYVLGLRPDMVFLPAPFLLHSWGWDQLGKQDDFIAAEAARNPVFEKRLEALTKVPGRPFFYSLGMEYLGPELLKLPGTWIPDGLSWEWTPGSRPAGDVLRREEGALSRERLRGTFSSDLSTSEIFHYYRNQAYLAVRWLQGRERGGAPETIPIPK